MIYVLIEEWIDILGIRNIENVVQYVESRAEAFRKVRIKPFC